MDKEKLLKRRLATDTVPVPGLGEVTVRGLTRAEVNHIGKGADPLETERRALALGMVEPELTEDEVGVWQDNAPAMEIQPVLQRINELSGLTKQVQKEAYKSLRGRPGA